jgi:hypothetical protein
MSYKIADILLTKRRFVIRREGNVPAIDREKVGKLHIRDDNKQKLGDLDVCAYDTRLNEILIFECKYLKPYKDMLYNLNLRPKLTSQDMNKAARRVKWVEVHRYEVLNWIGVANIDINKVSVRCIILTARPLYVEDVPNKVKIVPFGVFYSTVEEDGSI